MIRSLTRILGVLLLLSFAVAAQSQQPKSADEYVVAGTAIELLRKVVEQEPGNVFGQHALGMMYISSGDKTAAMQQYYILQNLDLKLAADLLAKIPN